MRNPYGGGVCVNQSRIENETAKPMKKRIPVVMGMRGGSTAE